MSLDTQGKCDAYKGIVKNAERKRKSREELTSIHDDTCPGRWKGNRK